MKRMCALVLLVGMVVYAGAAYGGEPTQVTLDNLVITIQDYFDGHQILVADQAEDLRMAHERRSRSWTFYANGMLMVFVGTDDVGGPGRADGSRMFQLLPLRGVVEPSYQKADGDSVLATSPGGWPVTLSRKTGAVTSVEGFKVTAAPLDHFSVMEKVAGGVEIVPEKGYILIDYGWRTGEIPLSQLSRSVIIRDGYGNSCKVRMSDLIMRDPTDADEVKPRFESNAAFDEFLKKKCPNIRR